MKPSFNPNVWGPHYWFFLHTIALTYPTHPNTIVKKRYYEFLTNLDIFLPDGKFAHFYKSLLRKYPLTPFLDNRKSLSKWMNFIHNKVNEKLEKKKVSLNQFYEDYNKLQNTHDEFHFSRLYKKFIFISIVISILIIIIIFYYYK